MNATAEFYKFILDLVTTILNYGPLGLALGGLFTVFFILKNFDLKRRGK